MGFAPPRNCAKRAARYLQAGRKCSWQTLTVSGNFKHIDLIILKLRPTRIRDFEMKKVLMCLVTVLFFACNSYNYLDDPYHRVVEALYVIKNTSNQTISFDVTVKKDELTVMAGFMTEDLRFIGFGGPNLNDSVFRCVLNPNDSTLLAVVSSREDFENYPLWFNKFDISSVDGIQMNDPYLPENWVQYNIPFRNGSLFSFRTDNPVRAYSLIHAPACLFTLNEE